MPRKNNSNAILGKSLLKSQNQGRTRTHASQSKHLREQLAHVDSELNLKSVTELNSLDEFLASADLMGTEFTAERLNVHYVQPQSAGIISEQELKHQNDIQMEYADAIRIPRRPKWTTDFTKEELAQSEKESFLSWRRKLAEISEEDQITLTPFEKNLEFWRQLWRVIERSDLVAQIVDARDPLLYRCEDLEDYVLDVGSNKRNMILVNKSDLLSHDQRLKWLQYFQKQNLPVAFFSAIHENERLTDLEKEGFNVLERKDEDLDLSDMSKLLTRNQLINFFETQLQSEKSSDHVLTIGMVGYPNVGKSSTINTIMRSKKVSVSATPGRTKHFQTLFIGDKLQLCDCPGLVFPSFVSSQAEMVLSGILPIDEMRNHVPAVNLLCQKIPRRILEATYGVNIIKPREGEDENRPPNAVEFLNAYGTMRGFMTAHGQPDHPRASRVILKDFVKGKLIYSESPPGVNQEEYSLSTPSVISQALQIIENDKQTDLANKDMSENVINTVSLDSALSKVNRAKNNVKISVKDPVENSFFRQDNSTALIKGNRMEYGTNKRSAKGPDGSKAWKKHDNKKKEKVRRTRRNLDDCE